MAKLIRKNVFLDPAALRRAQAALRARSESETIRTALDLVTFRARAIAGFDRAAGKAPGFRDVWKRK